MATSFLTIYRVEGLDMNKNFKIENMEQFLLLQSSQIVEPVSIQYQKIQLNMSVKINATQGMILKSFNFNYAKITFSTPTDAVFYFYIVGWQWLSENTIRIDLTLDVLNTLSFSFDKRTRILRQHGKQLHSYSRSGDTLTISRNIDLRDEGIHASLYRSEALEEMTLTPTGGSGTDIPVTIKENWYLIYRASENPDSNIPNKVYDAYLCADTPIKIYDADGIASPVTFVPNNFRSQTCFNYVIGTGNGEKVSYTPEGESAVNLDLALNEFVVFQYKDNTHFYVWHFKDDAQVDERKTIQTITIEKAKEGRWGVSPMSRTAESVLNARNKILEINAGVSYEFTVASIDSVDRTDTKLIKIIEIPYQPIFLKQHGLPSLKEYEFDSSKVVFDMNFSLLRLRYPWDVLTQEYVTQAPLLKPLQFTESVKTKAQYDLELRNDTYESKMYQGAFYRPTIIYDSFTYNIPLEKVEKGSEVASFNINFYFTSTINSRFMFVFEIPYAYEIEEDFEKVLYISRNNELTILNSEYLNYIRNGYNYDVKAKVRKDIGSVVRIGTSILGGATQENIIPSPAGIVNNVYNAINTSIENEESIQRRLQESQMRGVSVSNADAYDLMNVYAKNRLLSGVYKVSDTIETNLKDLFFYFGYSFNELGIPNTDSRIYFNFVQCEAVFENESLIRREYLMRLKELFNEGVTYLHFYQLHSGTYVYDLKQEKNNREVAFDNFLKTLN